MAEFVQLNLENMIPELETMQKIQLFTWDEVRRITKKRKEFEYKLQRGMKVEEDLLNYIRYEWDLLLVIKNKTLADKSVAPKRNNIAYSVARHIQKLFTEAIRRFGSDVSVWMSYIDFCLQLRFYHEMSSTLEKMLEIHQSKPQLFCTAAQTEYNIFNNMDRARKFFLNGLRLHKESELLYRESFAMELAYAKKVRKEYSDKQKVIPEDDPILSGRLAELIYESSLMNIPSINLVSDLFTIVKNYPFAEELTKRIYEDIVEKFKDHELRWDIVARYKLENMLPEHTAKDAIKGCVNVYKEAVKTLNTQEMWTHYIDTMLNLNEDLAYLKNFKINCLMQAFLGAHCAGMLKEDYYLKWASKLSEDQDKEKKRDVLKSGTNSYPGSVRLWEQYLMFLAVMSTSTSTSWNLVHKSFEEAVSQLKAHKACPLPLFKFMINYAQLIDPAKAEEIMKKGILFGGEVSITIKTMYLEWLVLSKGLKVGRKAYADLADLPPFSLNFHKKMIELENYSGAPSDVSKLRKCYETMVDQFGKDNAHVWMDYIKFEQNVEAIKVPQLYAMAKRTLKANHADTFVSLYSLYQIELNTSPSTAKEPGEPPLKSPKLSVDENSNDSKNV